MFMVFSGVLKITSAILSPLIIQQVFLKILQFQWSVHKIIMRRALVKSIGIFVKEFQFKTGIWDKIAVQQNKWWREQWDKLKKQYDVTVQKLTKQVITFKIRQKLELGVKGWTQALNPNYPMSPEERTRYRGFFLSSNQAKTNVAAMQEILELLQSLKLEVEHQYSSYSQAHQRYCAQYRKKVKQRQRGILSEGQGANDDHYNKNNHDKQQDEDNQFGLGPFGREIPKQAEPPRATDTPETQSRKIGDNLKNKFGKKQTRNKQTKIKKERKNNMVGKPKKDKTQNKQVRLKFYRSGVVLIQGIPNDENGDNYNQEFFPPQNKQISALSFSQISSNSVSNNSSQPCQNESARSKVSISKVPFKEKPQIYHEDIDKGPVQDNNYSNQKYF